MSLAITMMLQLFIEVIGIFCPRQSFVAFSDARNTLPASIQQLQPRNLNIYFMSASQMWVRKTRCTFVLNMSHVLTGVNSMVCVQLMLQTEPLGTVLALVGFLSSVLSWMGMSLCSISASFYVAPCTGLTCHGDSAKGKGEGVRLWWSLWPDFAQKCDITPKVLEPIVPRLVIQSET